MAGHTPPAALLRASSPLHAGSKHPEPDCRFICHDGVDENGRLESVSGDQLGELLTSMGAATAAYVPGTGQIQASQGARTEIYEWSDGQVTDIWGTLDS